MTEADSMSDASSDVPAQQPEGHESAAQSSAGELLRRAREEAGLSLSDLAGILKVNVKKLEALESDRLNLLPNAVFARGLASSVCRTLKLDPAPVLALLPRSDATARIEERTNLNTPFRSPSDMAGDSIWDQISRPAILAALAVLVAALVLILFPTIERKTETGAAPAPVATPTPAVAVGASEPAAVTEGGAATVAPAQTEGVETTSAARDQAVAPAVAVAPAKPAAGLPPSPSVPTPTPAAEPAKPVSVSGLIVVSTRGQSWIEVTDAEGGVRLSRLMEAGDSARASGPLPLKVVIGSADVTDVVVRGKPFDLNAIARSNVARFEVK